MISELFSMNGYGLYVWSAFTFTLLSFGYLYFVTKTQLIKEQSKFLKKYSNLTHNKVNVFKEQRTLKEILAYSNISKI
tara:strand:+ start:358 stop:591 length:234 start_codon:yes stop_codon:yes gene_type:complete